LNAKNLNNPISLKPQHQEFISADDIKSRIKELGKQITLDYAGKKPLFVCVLKGAFIFMSDLIREIDLDLEVDFIVVSSYGASTKSSGVVKMVLDLAKSIEGKDVILVEDIIDTSLTITYLINLFKQRNPASLNVCSFLLKEDVAPSSTQCEYVGFKIPNEFVVGYGLDLDQSFRNLDHVATYLGEGE
jgi:hypoxanthine phosphoribosyltransferase